MRRLLKFSSVWFLILLSAWQFIFAQSPSDRPNILLILADDLGYSDVGVCGAKDLLTPNIDRVFNEGMRFTQFYSNSSVCSPTRASIITGLYPDKAGVPGVIRTQRQNSWGYLKPDAITLADQLKSAGYHTALIGKWHLGLEKPNLPTMRGYEFFKGFLGDMMDDYYTHLRHGINYMRENEKEINPQGHATELFSRWAVDFIKSQSESKHPFFLQLDYNAPHDPIQPPAEWLEKVKNRQPGISEKRAKLVALIEHMDAGIGSVLRALEEIGQLENTLIIFTSDNGGKLQDGANNGSLREGKGSMYDGGLLVPTAFMWHNKIAPGSVTIVKAMSMDLYPTLLEVAGLTGIPSVDGRSVIPVLRGEQVEDTNRVFYFVRREGGNEYGGLTIQAIQQGNWKLLQNSPFGPQELYNLEEDPYESIDLMESEPEKYNELNRLLMKQIQHGAGTPWQMPQ